MHRLGQHTIPAWDEKFLARPAVKQAYGASMLIVLAPGGFGKTTALADWCRARGLAWLSLRHESADLQTLILDVCESLSTAYSEVEKPLANLRFSLPPNIDPALAASELVDAMAGVEGGWGLCMDDLQHVKDGSASAAMLENLIELASVNRIYIGLAGRSIPKLKSISKLRSSPNVVEIGAAELEFRADEVGDVVNRMFELDCTDMLVERLYNLTQGWPALVVLAGKWLRSRPAEVREQAIEQLSGADRSMYEYLATQILDDRPEAHRQFLLMSSLVRRVPAGLIDKLLPGAGLEIVHDLEFGRFVTPSVDAHGTTYTFHPLLADFLESKALSELGAVTIERVRRTAAEWFAKHDAWNEAFRLWHLAGDQERIAHQMVEWEQEFKEWWTDYKRWLEIVDESILEKYPRLLLRHAMNMANLGSIDSALAWIDKAERAAADGTEEDRLDVESVRAIVLFFGNFSEESMELCKRLEPRLDSMSPFQRSTLCTALVLLHNNDYIDPERSLKFLEIYEDTVNRAGYLRGRFIATANRAVAARLIGDYEKQRGVLEQLRAAVPDGKVPRLYEGLIRFSEALAALELGLSSGQDEMGKAIALLETFGARGQIQYGRHASALLLAEAGQRVHDKVQIGAAAVNHPYKEEAEVFGHLALAMEAAQLGNLRRAFELADEAIKSSTSEFLYAFSKLEAARIHALHDDLDGAVSLCMGLENSKFRAIAVRAMVLLAGAGLLKADQLRELLLAVHEPHYRELLECRERPFAVRMLVRAMAESIEAEAAAELLSGMGIRPLRVRTFGGLTVACGDVIATPELWERPQAKTLFAYLLLQNGRPVHSEVIIDVFWPEADSKAGRANFKTACSRVRKALEVCGVEANLAIDENDLVTLELPEEAWFDFVALERLAELQAGAEPGVDSIDIGRRALGIAAREFLPEYRYEDWAAEARARLDSVVQKVRIRLADDLIAEGLPDEALDIANDISVADCFDEDGVRLQILALKALARKGDAARIYRAYCERIKTELGLAPSPTLAKLAGTQG